MTQVPDGTAPQTTSRVFVLVFFGPSRDLGDAVEAALERSRKARFLCILGRDEDSAKVGLFWRAHVESRFPSAALITVHDDRDRVTERVADLASVLREQYVDLPIEVGLLLGPPGTNVARDAPGSMAALGARGSHLCGGQLRRRASRIV
jgi:hypothetical protein